MVKYIGKDFKSIINIHKFIDSWFWCRYGINTYNGCQFGCIYCDSRSAKYYLPKDFDNTIIVKNNVKDMLDKRLSRARTLRPDIVGLSGANDPYQPAEKEYKNTRQCLEVLDKHKYPVHVTTKSILVLRDLDLLDSIGENNWCTVSITITTTNAGVARFLEKRAPSPLKRFNIINTIKKRAKHIQTGVLLIPAVPYLADSNEDLENMVKMTKESAADYILFGGGMTMRDRQALWFLKHLSRKLPKLISAYEELYKFAYKPEIYEGTYEPKRGYSRKINKKMFELCEKYKLNYRVKRFIPNDYRSVNYLIAEKLLNNAYALQIHGKPWTKTFWVGHNIQNLKESIVDIAKRKELRKIRNVDKEIESFISNII